MNFIKRVIYGILGYIAPKTCSRFLLNRLAKSYEPLSEDDVKYHRENYQNFKNIWRKSPGKDYVGVSLKQKPTVEGAKPEYMCVPYDSSSTFPKSLKENR